MSVSLQGPYIHEQLIVDTIFFAIGLFFIYVGRSTLSDETFTGRPHSLSANFCLNLGIFLIIIMILSAGGHAGILPSKLGIPWTKISYECHRLDAKWDGRERLFEQLNPRGQW